MAKKYIPVNPVTESSEEVSHGWRLRTETTKGSVEPAHYKKFTIEPFDFIHKNEIGFAEGNVIKYICRWRDKDGIEDLKKAMRYIELIIEGEINETDS